MTTRFRERLTSALQLISLGAVGVLLLVLGAIGRATFFPPAAPADFGGLADRGNDVFLLSAAIAALAYTASQAIDGGQDRAAGRELAAGASEVFLGSLWFLTAIGLSLGVTAGPTVNPFLGLFMPVFRYAGLAFYAAATAVASHGLNRVFLGLIRATIERGEAAVAEEITQLPVGPIQVTVEPVPEHDERERDQPEHDDVEPGH